MLSNKINDKVEKSKMKIRYLTLEKFLYLLNDSSLFFSNINLLNDYTEGLLNSTYHDSEKHYIIKTEPIGDNFNNLINDKKRMSEKIYVNSWSNYPEESFALWEIYLKNSNGVAIISDESKILDSIFFKNINYGNINYHEKSVYSTNILVQNKTKNYTDEDNYKYFSKYNFFNYENEFRLLINKKEILDDNLQYLKQITHKDNIIGYNVDIDITKLIFKIIVSPKANEPFFNLIKDVVCNYNIDKQIVEKSNLNY